MRSPEDTIAAVATPLGEGGVGIVRVSGSRALEIVNGLFRCSRLPDLRVAPGYSCHPGQFLHADGPRAVLDHVLVTVFRAPRSYTGEDVAEISAHGSPFLLRQILAQCLRRGARLADPGEFTQRAFLAGKLDLTQAEAVAELIRAQTDRTQAAALDQLDGRLSREVRRLRDRLLPLLAQLEVGLDHSDEDHDFLDRRGLAEGCRGVREGLDGILASAATGKILREGLRLAIIGRPNVGKSSLLNALLNEDRAIVTPIPGTTRDTLEERVDWDGIPVVLTDTAGLRAGPADTVETLGMERTQRALAAADLLLAVFDQAEPLQPEDRTVLDRCAGRPHLRVANKADQPARWPIDALAGGGAVPALRVSAKTGDGLPALVQAVKDRALAGAAGAAEAHWLLNARHREALERAREALEQAIAAAEGDAFEEVVALELRTALSACGEIIGETATEDLLDRIFKDFCVGK